MGFISIGKASKHPRHRMASFLRILCVMSVLSRSEAQLGRLPHLPRAFIIAENSESKFEKLFEMAGKFAPVTTIATVAGSACWFLYNAVTSSKTELKTDMARQEARLETSMARQEASIKTDMARLETNMSDLKNELKTDRARLETSMSDLKNELKTDRARQEASMSDLKNEFRSDIARRLGKLEGLDQNGRNL
jgi:septal ring factor EnvC (AmiA/AmiB activator)